MTHLLEEARDGRARHAVDGGEQGRARARELDPLHGPRVVVQAAVARGVELVQRASHAEHGHVRRAALLARGRGARLAPHEPVGQHVGRPDDAAGVGERDQVPPVHAGQLVPEVHLGRVAELVPPVRPRVQPAVVDPWTTA